MTEAREKGLRVVVWYQSGHRDLPWRKTTDPYRILVSELMLQQTRVETVLGYYERFLEAFPDATSLACASGEAVMSLWQGLGYYSRARNLQKAVIAVIESHGGVFPSDPKLLGQLPGIGPYTAGAIASIAFNVPAPAVDGNVLRVMSRLLCLEGDIGQATTKNSVTLAVRDMIPAQHAADFCQGMMELGATVCTPVSPDCAHCPLQGDCMAYVRQMVGKFPIRTPKAAPQDSCQAVFLVVDPHDRVLLVFRKSGLLGGLWGLPHFESESDEPDLEELITHLHGEPMMEEGQLVLRNLVGTTRHVFTHRLWRMRIWRVDFLSVQITESESESYKWLPMGLLDTVPIPEAFRKVLRVAGMSRKGGASHGN